MKSEKKTENRKLGAASKNMHPKLRRGIGSAIVVWLSNKSTVFVLQPLYKGAKDTTGVNVGKKRGKNWKNCACCGRNFPFTFCILAKIRTDNWLPPIVTAN